MTAHFLTIPEPCDLVCTIHTDCPDGTACLYWNHIHHVMIYLGDGKVMQSTDSKIEARKGVVIQDFTQSDAVYIYRIIRISDKN